MGQQITVSKKLFLNFNRTYHKILKIGTPMEITIAVLKIEQCGFSLQYCVQKMEGEKETV